jgi:hypothetical protein
MMSKAQACATLIHISMMIETYGDMNTLFQIEALNTASMVVRAILAFHKEVFSEEIEEYKPIPTGDITALNFSNIR